MTSLVAVSSHLPPSVPISSLGAELGLTDADLLRYQRWYGFSHVCRSRERSDAALVLRATEKLNALHGRESHVRYVIRARSVIGAVPFPAAAVQEVRRELGLGRASAFNVGHHLCASGLLAVDVAGLLLADDADPDAMALILVGEHAVTSVGAVIRETTVMGEASAAVLVQRGGDQDTLLGYASTTYGDFYADLTLSRSAATRFSALYRDALIAVVREAVDRAGLSLADITLVLPHHVNVMSWRQVCRDLDMPLSWVYLENLSRIGHCYGADSFINLQSCVEAGQLNPGDHYIMTSVGLGATFSAMVFRH